MKNKRIFDAWNKIEPDAAADARMLDAILARNQAGQPETRKGSKMNKTIKWRTMKWCAPVAACLALAIIGTIMIPKLMSNPIAPTLPDDPPAQTQGDTEEIQQVSLPAMLAGQEVKWENLSVKSAVTDNKPTGKDWTDDVPPDADWSVAMFSSDGVQLQFSSKDTKVVGTLADGRKITVAIEETGRSQKAAEKNAVSITTSLIDPELNIEVGSTIMEFSFMDETGTTAYRCYITAIA